MPGTLQSTVQQQVTNRRETVKKLIQQFENQSVLQDLKKTEKIHTFSEKSNGNQRVATSEVEDVVGYIQGAYHAVGGTGRHDVVGRRRDEAKKLDATNVRTCGSGQVGHEARDQGDREVNHQKTCEKERGARNDICNGLGAHQTPIKKNERLDKWIFTTLIAKNARLDLTVAGTPSG